MKQAVTRITGEKTSYMEHERRKGTPFISRIADAEIPRKFKMPVLTSYTGKEDLVSHINKFEIQIDIQKVSEDARCRIFPTTLSNAAQEGYFKFSPASINSRDMFVKEFYS